MPNEIAIKVKKIDTGPLDQVGPAGQRAGKQAGAGLERGFRDGEQGAQRALKGVDDRLDKTAQHAKQAGAEAGSGFGEQLTQGAQGVLDSGGMTDALSSVLGQVSGLGGPALAAGGLLGGLIISGFQTSLERGEVGATLAGELGGTVADAGRFGNLAGDIYASNFGDSVAGAAEGIKAVVQNKLVDIDAGDAAIKRMSELALTAAKVTGETANSVARATRQLLVTDLVGSAEEAFNLIVTASQRGLNVNEDLIDTIVEYSTKFRDLGIDGKEALGLISQAMEAGARDTDYAADALKEFSIRAIDGSEATKRGFDAVGLDAEKMGDRIARGGSAARKALDLTLDGLRAIEDPVLRNQAAVDLFGTKAEDLGDALFAMDLDTVAKQFGDLEGATDDASTAMETDAQKASKAWKQFSQGVGDAVDFVGAKFYDLGGAMAHVLNLAEKIPGTPVVPTGLEDIGKLNNEVGSVALAFAEEGDAIDGVTRSLEKNIAMHREAAGIFLSNEEAAIKYQEALDDAAASLKENGRTLDINTEKGRENRQSLLDIADAAYGQVAAMEQSGATQEAVAGQVAIARDQFLDMAIKMGMSRDEANRLADKLKLIPGDYKANVYMDATGFNEVGSGVLATLNRLSKGVTVPVTGRVGAGLGLAHGGVVGSVGHAAAGGPRSNAVLVGEYGPEIIEAAPGSRVHSNADSMRMMAGSGGGAPMVVEFHFPPGGSTIEQLLAALWQKGVRDGLINAYAGGQRVQVR